MAGVERGRRRWNLGERVWGCRLREGGVKPGHGHRLRVVVGGGGGGGRVYCEGLESKENKLETQKVCQKIYLYSVLVTGFTDQLL